MGGIRVISGCVSAIENWLSVYEGTHVHVVRLSAPPLLGGFSRTYSCSDFSSQSEIIKGVMKNSSQTLTPLQMPIAPADQPTS
ncbi:unnamed protein product [Bemisia tabaci]|uniref:Uncharacterized protein n=1 Tax=Bemisia tabaci TaxID=7038 RepID=A0A9P0ANC9_BEMTA|nr:unnamed protein product [Bemisia tabaci]